MGVDVLLAPAQARRGAWGRARWMNTPPATATTDLLTEERVFMLVVTADDIRPAAVGRWRRYRRFQSVFENSAGTRHDSRIEHAALTPNTCTPPC
jgi:hypothetical protein